MIESSWLWMVVVGFLVAFVLAFGLGANDVANTFGISVGSKVLTVRQACILGTIFELLGAILVGARVSNTIRKGIISPDLFTNGTEDVFIAGNVAALSGSCLWLLVATFFKLPVSGTHSIVGATLGFSMVVNGVKGIGWMKLGMIASSWFISPVLSGLVSCGLFLLIDFLVLKKEKPLEPGLKLLPIFYAVTIAVNLFSVFFDGSKMLKFDQIPLYGTFILTVMPSILIAVFVKLVVVPKQRDKLKKESETEVSNTAKDGSEEKEMEDRSAPDKDINNTNSSVEKDAAEATNTTAPSDTVESERQKRELAREQVQDQPETRGLFSFLQVLTAVFGSFAHGGNDVSNAIGPLAALWITANTGDSNQKAPVPVWILVYGGVGISIGLWVWGRRVMKTLGEDLTKVTPSSYALLSGACYINVMSMMDFVYTYWKPVPVWILVYGGVGISIGLWVWGRRVMKTLGEDLTKITPSSGFCIEIGSALTVLIASNVGIPISTTHCKVGSVVFVGRVRSRESVDWKLFRSIVIAWFVTLPVSGGLSAGFMAIFNDSLH